VLWNYLLFVGCWLFVVCTFNSKWNSTKYSQLGFFNHFKKTKTKNHFDLPSNFNCTHRADEQQKYNKAYTERSNKQKPTDKCQKSNEKHKHQHTVAIESK
jgi:hypothetical protein